ncbi:hypothetical protein GCM10020229_17770 [Kitasatospora albolonga]
MALGRTELFGHRALRGAAPPQQLARPPVQRGQFARPDGGQQVTPGRRVTEAVAPEQPGRVQQVERPGDGVRYQQQEFGQQLRPGTGAEHRHATCAAQRQRVDPVQAVHQPAPVTLPHDEPTPRSRPDRSRPGRRRTDRPHRRRHTDRRRPGRRRVHRCGGPLLVVHQRVHQQRVPARQRVRLGRQPVGGAAAQPLAEQLRDHLHRQQLQPDLVVVRLAGQLDLEEGVGRGHGLARAEHGEHGRVPGPAHQVEQELQRLRVDVLPVVHRHQDGAPARQAPDQAEQALQGPLGELAGATVGGHRAGALRHALGEQPLGALGLRVVQVGALEQLSGQPERELALQRRAGAQQDLRALTARQIGEGVQQFGATAADRAVQRRHATRPGGAALQAPDKAGELVLAPGGPGSGRIQWGGREGEVRGHRVLLEQAARRTGRRIALRVRGSGNAGCGEHTGRRTRGFGGRGVRGQQGKAFSIGPPHVSATARGRPPSATERAGAAVQVHVEPGDQTQARGTTADRHLLHCHPRFRSPGPPRQGRGA